MTKATSRSNATAPRDEVVPRRIRRFGSSRDALCESQLQRLASIAVIPPERPFRQIDPVARDLKPGRKNESTWQAGLECDPLRPAHHYGRVDQDDRR
jgi:hypothetical protein